MAGIINARERLLEVLDKDRKELAGCQSTSKDAVDEVRSSADRVARNMALIRAYEARNGG
jgi:hypothetical protein